ncbi:MAG: hypothetical protein COU68_00885 [Candidatus Pacebacteria bacterium CG10_big_fil_rev_8_21_14_0_10_45_6]|nr:MAG: hypothetical protein COU68_00885 [Candidatus Pacebacteria bacterium CG10_big_fil_rev_8_21_14_0_10_45_6]
MFLGHIKASEQALAYNPCNHTAHWEALHIVPKEGFSALQIGNNHFVSGFVLRVLHSVELGKVTRV